MDAGQAAFEAARIAELAVSGVGADVARIVAQDEWRQMDDAARKWCCEQAAAVVVPDADPPGLELDLPVSELLSDPPGLDIVVASPVRSLERRSSSTDGSKVIDLEEAALQVKSRPDQLAQSSSSASSAPEKPNTKNATRQTRKRKVTESAQPEGQVGDGKRSSSARGEEGENSDGWLKVHSGEGYVQGDDDASRSLDDKDLDIEMFRAFRTSHNISVGGQHPDWLTEPSSVSQISLPVLPRNTFLRLPVSVAKENLLSSPQLESVSYAVRRFSSFLPNGSRCGYFLGDGTGCGKGRVIAALAWHLWNSGARRHVWLSATADLVEDAVRDLKDLGAALPISNLSKWSYGKIGTGKGLDSNGNGIIFASYSIFVSSSTKGGQPSPENSRVMQLIDWLKRDTSGGKGLIALDEAHRAKNVGVTQQKFTGSKTALSALEMVRACPNCAVLYSSATGATEIRHIGYLERLGLWGPGRPHKSFEELQEAVENGGLAAMELIAMTMRAEGMLSCRALSFKGTSFRLQQVPLAGSTLETYVAACALWQEAYRLLTDLTKARKAGHRAKRLKISITDDTLALTHRHFWGYQQQFFKQLLVCAKVEETVALAQAAILRNEAVVIAMWSTGEAITSQKLERENAVTSDGFASAPREIALRLMEKVLEPMIGEDQRQYESRLRQLRDSFSRLKLPSNPLDDLMHRLGGPSKVAELSGRSRRLVGTPGSKDVYLQERGEGSNLAEQKAFQLGEKRVAVITEAASAGISLHCDLRLPAEAQRARYMITVELPWEADKAVQQLGRVHRSNQKVPPKFAVVVTELGGEVRFVSAVARRLRILGAMMRGDRNSAHGAVQSLAAFDLQNRYGRRALSRFYELLRTDQYASPEVNFSFLKARGHRSAQRRWPSWYKFCQDAVTALTSIGLKPDSDDKFDESTSASKNLNVFMNRIMMLEPGIQNALFDGVAELYSYMIGQDRAEGSFDDGLESLDRQGRQKASVSIMDHEVLYKDPETGAETTYVRLRIDRSISWQSAHQTWDSDCDSLSEGFYWLQGKREVVLAVARPHLQARPGIEDDDDEDPLFDLLAPRGTTNRHSGRLVTAEMLRDSPFQKARDSELDQIERVWKAQLAVVGDARLTEAHVLSGSILNTWAVVGSAMGQASSPARAGMPRKIPLVRAQLSNGDAVVGVRVRPDCLEGVRYALRQLLKQASECRAKAASQEPCSLDITRDEVVESASMEENLQSVEELSESIEDCLKKTLDRHVESGWAGVHAALVERGAVDSGAQGMRAVQEAVEHLRTNGKVEIDEASGAVTLLIKQAGNGWYIPPPKKPKTKSRGRGRGRGRGV